MMDSAIFSYPTKELSPILKNTQNVVGHFDTEYTQVEGPHDKPPTFTKQRINWNLTACRNRILSYQLISGNTETGHHLGRIIFPDGVRLTLGDLILQIVEDAGIPKYMLRPQSKDAKPLKVLINCFFADADLSSLEDREKLFNHEHVILRGGGIFTVKPIEWTFDIRDGNRHRGVVELTIRDLYTLNDPGTSLDMIGEVHGLKKIELPAGYQKNKMDVFLNDLPDKFKEYAMRDVEICDAELDAVVKAMQDILGLDKIPVTAGNASVSGYKKFIGTEQWKYLFQTEGLRGKSLQTSNSRKFNESAILACYQGGMNQSYTLGHQQGCIFDLDIDGAYGGAMGVVPAIDWNSWAKPNNKERFTPQDLANECSFALIKFKFPDDTKYPNIPVRTPYGMVFPLSNEGIENVFVTGIELREALNQGCEVDIIRGVTFPVDGLLCADFIKKMVEVRNQYPKADPRNKAAKLGINCLYGKFGQGYAEQYTNEEIFTAREINRGDKIGHCDISFPFAGAVTTALIRAVLNVMVKEADKLGVVLSATTDGCMVKFPSEDTIKQFKSNCEQYYSVKLLIQGRANVGYKNPNKWIEIKHRGTDAYTIKTRINAIWGIEGQDHKAVVGFRKTDIEFEDLIAIHQSRESLFYSEPRLTKAGDIQDGTAQDIVMGYRSKQVNLSPDWKRFFLPDGTSRPHKSMKEYYKIKEIANSLKDQAWPETIGFLVSQGRIPRTPQSSLHAIRKQIGLRIIQGMEGYRLPKGMTQKEASLKLGMDEKGLVKLKSKKPVLTELPVTIPELEKIKSEMGLW